MGEDRGTSIANDEAARKEEALCGDSIFGIV